MTTKKPITPKIEQRAEQAYQFMLGKGYVTKGELAELFGWEYPKQDRQIRDVISVLSHKYPIISLSDSNKGFKLAQNDSDLEQVKHSIAEINSRINELRKRLTPLIDFNPQKPIKWELL
jgi:hypothetical protein